jgi:hypothetical protein
MRVDPIAVDSRGRIFAYVGCCVTTPEPGFAPSLTATPDDLCTSQASTLRSEVDYFMKNNGGTPPASLLSLVWHPDPNATGDFACPARRLLRTEVSRRRIRPRPLFGFRGLPKLRRRLHTQLLH